MQCTGEAMAMAVLVSRQHGKQGLWIRVCALIAVVYLCSYGSPASAEDVSAGGASVAPFATGGAHLVGAPGVGSIKDRLCEDCENEGIIVINEVLNAVLNGGILNACSDVCQHLSTPKRQTICMDACRAVGIATFVETVKKFSNFIDVTYFCHLAHMCTAREGGAVQNASLTVTPAEAKSGTEVTLVLTMEVTSDLGAGMIRVVLVQREGKSKSTKPVSMTDLPGRA